ncbi:hypothetical protein FOA52_012175 [Chlamydomonas sp. UWO 241]|nr:hypothetical protein FOA52_012175 [Chlamydomonas sp. UWO 241]
MAAKPKLKLLCLHGHLQNNEVFRSKIGSMRKALKSRCEFEFVEGPYEAAPHPLSTGSGGLPSAAEEGGVEIGGRSWWQWSDSEPDGRPSRAMHYSGWEPSLQVLIGAIKEHRPDGILGFSQGAAAGAMLLSCLCTEEAAGQLEEAGVQPPRFAVLIAGFLPRDPSFCALVTAARPSVPTLFVYGTSDALVPPTRSQELIAAFDPSTSRVFQHAGAHLSPTCSGAFKTALTDFLDEQASTVGSSGSG